MTDLGCSSSAGVTCTGCGARFAHLPGVRCPRCGTAFEMCASCQGCGLKGGGPAGESALVRIQRWLAARRDNQGERTPPTASTS